MRIMRCCGKCGVYWRPVEVFRSVMVRCITSGVCPNCERR